MSFRNRYPVLRNLMVFQLASVLIGTIILFISVVSFSNQQIKATTLASQQDLKHILQQQEDKWLAWKTLGQDEVLSEELDRISRVFPSWTITVLPLSNYLKTAGMPLSESHILLPDVSSENPSDYVIYATLNRSGILRQNGFFSPVFYFMTIASILFLTVLVISAIYIYTRIYRPFSEFLGLFLLMGTNQNFSVDHFHAKGEIRYFFQEVIRLHQSAKGLEKDAALCELAKQVAHDIRSPLGALEMAIRDQDFLSAESRTIVREATRRIKDIANNLLQKNKNHASSDSQNDVVHVDDRLSVEPLEVLLESILSEKRMLYFDAGLEISFVQNDTRSGLFATVDPMLFKRLISNLINNSVEAMHENPIGRKIIEVTLVEALESQIRIIIKDTGKGFPEEILKNVGQRGLSVGKLESGSGSGSGSGLGIYHAVKVVKNWNGDLTVSNTKEGAVVTISLQRAEAPKWFIGKLNLSTRSEVFILDDDQSIHLAWDKRLKDRGIERIQHFYTFESVRLAYREGFHLLEDAIFLIDHELIGQPSTGLELIQALCIQSQSILVTSYHEEPNIRIVCQNEGIRLLPKQMVGTISIT